MKFTSTVTLLVIGGYISCTDISHMGVINGNVVYLLSTLPHGGRGLRAMLLSIYPSVRLSPVASTDLVTLIEIGRRSSYCGSKMKTC